MRLYILTICTWILCTPLLVAQLEPDPALAEAQQDRIKSAIKDLIYEVDRLQEMIIEELSERKERRLYLQADRILETLIPLSEKVTSQLSRTRLYQHFDKVDQLTHQLVNRALQVKSRGVNQSAGHVLNALLELHYQITAGDASPKRQRKALQHQMEAFTIYAQKLKKTARYTLTGPVVSSIDQLAEESQKLTKEASKLDKLSAVRKHFISTNQAWNKVVAQLRLLPPRKNVYLLRSAAWLDQIHKRIFHLLKMKGERATFTFRI